MLESVRADGNLAMQDAWEKMMILPSTMPAQEKVNRQEALLLVLEDMVYEEKDAAAAILLAQVCAFEEGTINLQPFSWWRASKKFER